MNETGFRVRYSETDGMGIVHHSNYIRWFEVGRVEYLRALGIDYARMERDGICAPILRVEVDYKHPSVFDEEVIIQTRVVSYSRLRLRFGYRVYNARRELLCEGQTVQTFVGRDMLPVNPMKVIPEIINAMIQCAEDDKSL